MTDTRTYERVTVNLTERTAAALTLAVELTGDTKTDTINRALQVYSYLLHVHHEGRTVLVTDEDGQPMRIEFL